MPWTVSQFLLHEELAQTHVSPSCHLGSGQWGCFTDVGQAKLISVGATMGVLSTSRSVVSWLKMSPRKISSVLPAIDLRLFSHGSGGKSPKYSRKYWESRPAGLCFILLSVCHIKIEQIIHSHHLSWLENLQEKQNSFCYWSDITEVFGIYPHARCMFVEF